MKYTIYAMAEPEHDEMWERLPDSEMVRAEEEHMRKAELDMMKTEAGIDPEQVKLSGFEVVGYEEAVWDVESNQETRNKLEAAGWQFFDESELTD
jgi:hypothetical protein